VTGDTGEKSSRRTSSRTTGQGRKAGSAHEALHQKLNQNLPSISGRASATARSARGSLIKRELDLIDFD
jgi:hypothetical protein